MSFFSKQINVTSFKKKQTKRFHYLLIISLICIFTIFLSSNVFYQIKNTENSLTNSFEQISQGTVIDIINTRADMKNYVDAKYKGFKNYKIDSVNYKYVNSINLSQNILNNVYRGLSGIQYWGTCSEVAITILTLMYANSEQLYPEYTFKAVLDYAIKEGYFITNGGGTYSADLDKIQNYALDLYNSSRSKNAYDNYWNPYNILKYNAERDQLTMFNIYGHSMVGAGYYEYNISWKKEIWIWFFGWHPIFSIPKKETVRFAIVNQGWANAIPSEKFEGADGTYQYFPEEKIGGNFITQILGTLFDKGSYFNVEIK